MAAGAAIGETLNARQPCMGLDGKSGVAERTSLFVQSRRGCIVRVSALTKAIHPLLFNAGRI